MKVRYIGKSFGTFALTNGKIYECTAIEGGMLRIIDDEEYGDGYLYAIINPGSLYGSEEPSKWEIIEDNENGDLKKLLKNLKKKQIN